MRNTAIADNQTTSLCFSPSSLIAIGAYTLLLWASRRAGGARRYPATAPSAWQANRSRRSVQRWRRPATAKVLRAQSRRPAGDASLAAAPRPRRVRPLRARRSGGAQGCAGWHRRLAVSSVDGFTGSLRLLDERAVINSYSVFFGATRRESVSNSSSRWSYGGVIRRRPFPGMPRHRDHEAETRCCHPPAPVLDAWTAV